MTPTELWVFFYAIGPPVAHAYIASKRAEFFFDRLCTSRVAISIPHEKQWRGDIIVLSSDGEYKGLWGYGVGKRWE